MLFLKGVFAFSSLVCGVRSTRTLSYTGRRSSRDHRQKIRWSTRVLVPKKIHSGERLRLTDRLILLRQCKSDLKVSQLSALKTG
ncbi:hypothetical protein GQ44DRAFT_707717 [Phaeosphaeriaceae sp. PMI808]|nr:hypothetical protein GQ44DRAFT_707717 [Phaeosphaeriaceae sp. PMI808]